MADFKEGLDFYSHYIGMTRDRKLRTIRKKYGSTGVDVWLAVLDLIYADKGYYITYGNDEQKDSVAWDILDYVKGKYAPDVTTVEEIIESLVACELFSGDLFKLGILSSKRIQLQYYKGTVERKAIKVIPEYWLVSVDEMKKISERSSILQQFSNLPIIRQNQPIGEQNQPNIGQSKVKESKRNEMKRNESKPADGGLRNLFQKNEFDNSEYRQQLVDIYGEDLVAQYEKKFDDWTKDKKAVNVNKYFEIDKWLCEDFR